MAFRKFAIIVQCLHVAHGKLRVKYIAVGADWIRKYDICRLIGHGSFNVVDVAVVDFLTC